MSLQIKQHFIDPKRNINIHNLSQLAESPDTPDYSHISIKMQQKRYNMLKKLVTFIMNMKTEKCVPLLSTLDRMLFMTWHTEINCQPIP